MSKLTKEEALNRCRSALWVATEDEDEVEAILAALREPEPLSDDDKRLVNDAHEVAINGDDMIDLLAADDLRIVRVKP